MEPRILPLTRPLELRSKETGQVLVAITELRLRRPTLGDLVDAMSGAGPATSRGEFTIHFASLLSGTPVADLRRLDITDGMALMEALVDFMPAGLLTGSSGSPSSPAASASPPTGEAGGQPNSASGVVVPLSGSAG